MNEFLKSLGEKATRTDLWVVTILVYFWLCATDVNPCEYSFTETFIIGAMFLDMGVNVMRDIFKK